MVEMTEEAVMIGAGVEIEMTIEKSRKNIVNIKRRVKKRNIKRNRKSRKVTKKTTSQRKTERANDDGSNLDDFFPRESSLELRLSMSALYIL
jgi:hypothetical protein